MTSKLNDDLRPGYDLSTLKDGVRGKYCRQAVAGTNLVFIESVHRALRVVAEAARDVSQESLRHANHVRPCLSHRVF